MINALGLDEKTIKHIPALLALIVVVFLGLPTIALNYLSTDFGAFIKALDSNGSLSAFVVETDIRRYLLQLLLHWSAFTVAAITVLLAFTQYYLTNDKIALIIGLTLLFSGSMNAMHALDFRGPSYLNTSENINALVWTFTNSVNGMILMKGLLLLLRGDPSKITRFFAITLVGILLVIAMATYAHYTTVFIFHPSTWFKINLSYKLYAFINLAIYTSIVLFICPKIYKKFPGILASCISYTSIVQIIISIYLMLLPDTTYANAYSITPFLKITLYSIPFACLIINYIHSFHSILESQNELQISQDQLKYNAAHDVLTNLYNRREFENLLDITIANSAREYRHFALFLIDIDNFKSINDTLGHLHGDHFLKKFSEQLATLTRRGDILSRIGGDEFAVITSTLNSAKFAEIVAERVIKGLNTPYPVGDQLLSGTVSIGISIYPMDGETTEELLKNADIAMYHAKNAGKNTYRFYSEKLCAEQHREAKIESHLRNAIKNNELSLYYQPQYNLVTKKIVGAEILLRWTNKHIGVITTDEFVTIAERSHLMVSIGNWVLHKTCEQAAHWSAKYKHNLVFSINVSPIQLENNSFVQYFKTTLEKFNYPANQLCIEITEHLLMKNNEMVNYGLRSISGIGSSISLSDFRMCDSSLSRLKLFPIDMLKIDKLFVADIINDIDNVIVIDTIIRLAHELKISITAQGIDTKTQLDYLVSRKCIKGQGFYLNKPLTAKAFEKLAYS